MDSEKGNRVFARGHNVPPPLVFGAQKKSLVWIGLRLARLPGAGEGDESFVQSASIIGLVIRLRAWSQGDLEVEVEEVVGVCAVRSATDAALVGVGARHEWQRRVRGL